MKPNPTSQTTKTSETRKTDLLQPNSAHCFACGMSNPFGLKLRFYQTAPDEVTAEITPPGEYQGFPGILHGGITASILDEAVCRAHMGVDPHDTNFMYTVELNIKYRNKILIGEPLKVVGKKGERKRWIAESKGYIYSADGTLLAEASATLVDLPNKFSEMEREELGWMVYPEEEK